MAEEPISYTGVLMNAVMASVAGLIGIITGIRVHGSKINDIEQRLTRIENKLDRMIEREIGV